MPYTPDQLRSMSPQARANLYENALRKKTPESQVIIDQLIQHNLLSDATGSLTADHPLILQIEEIIRSSAGRKAAEAAASGGLPAMAGVDPLLQEALGAQYRVFGATSWAGFLVADVMRGLGYKQKGEKPLPPGCVAKTGAFFET